MKLLDGDLVPRTDGTRRRHIDAQFCLHPILLRGSRRVQRHRFGPHRRIRPAPVEAFDGDVQSRIAAHRPERIVPVAATPPIPGISMDGSYEDYARNPAEWIYRTARESYE